MINNISSVNNARTQENINFRPDKTTNFNSRNQEAIDEGINDNSKEVSDNLLNKAIEKANKALENVNRKIEREIHEKTHAVIFRIKDSETNEVIVEYPSEKIQDMIAKMWELAGLFVDERA